MDTRMLYHAKYRQSIRDMTEEDFKAANAAPNPSSINGWSVGGEEIEPEEQGEGKRTSPYQQYLRQRRKPFWIKLGFFAATVLAFVLVYFLVIARS